MSFEFAVVFCYFIISLFFLLVSEELGGVKVSGESFGFGPGEFVSNPP